MTEQANPPFDPQVFLSTVNGGRTLATYAKDDVIFSQGETADAVFYIQTGQVKIVVTSEQGKEAVVGIAGPPRCGPMCRLGMLRTSFTPTRALSGPRSIMSKTAMVDRTIRHWAGSWSCSTPECR